MCESVSVGEGEGVRGGGSREPLFLLPLPSPAQKEGPSAREQQATTPAPLPSFASIWRDVFLRVCASVCVCERRRKMRTPLFLALLPSPSLFRQLSPLAAPDTYPRHPPEPPAAPPPSRCSRPRKPLRRSRRGGAPREDGRPLAGGGEDPWPETLPAPFPPRRRERPRDPRPPARGPRTS